jgi:hypothetical protein
VKPCIKWTPLLGSVGKNRPEPKAVPLCVAGLTECLCPLEYLVCNESDNKGLPLAWETAAMALKSVFHREKSLFARTTDCHK